MKTFTISYRVAHVNTESAPSITGSAQHVYGSSPYRDGMNDFHTNPRNLDVYTTGHVGVSYKSALSSASIKKLHDRRLTLNF